MHGITIPSTIGDALHLPASDLALYGDKSNALPSMNHVTHHTEFKPGSNTDGNIYMTAESAIINIKI